jgi:hypothetical protein
MIAVRTVIPKARAMRVLRMMVKGFAYVVANHSRGKGFGMIYACHDVLLRLPFKASLWCALHRWQMV